MGRHDKDIRATRRAARGRGSRSALSLAFALAAIAAFIPIRAYAASGTEASSAARTTLAKTSGFRADFSAGAAYAPSYGSDTALLGAFGYRANAGLEYAAPFWIPLRAELGFYSVGASAFDSTLFRYRAFGGWRLAAFTGVRLPIGAGEFDILAGGALSASKYANLSAVTAYASAAGELRYLAPLSFPFLRGLLGGRDITLVAGLPVEYMFRGTARTLSAGLDLGLGVKLEKKASK